MAEIRLTKGEVAYIDDEDIELIEGKSWYAVTNCSGNIYVQAYHYYGPSNYGRIFIHQLILGITYIDHIDNNGLNNHRVNLRPASHSQNAMNRRKISGTSSQFKGVGWHKSTGCWRAYIKLNGKTKSLGYYHNEIDAAKAYDRAAREMFGEFALLNLRGD